MLALSVRNVQQALVEGCHQMRQRGVEMESRNGPVLRLPGVWVTEYRNPTERVLLDPVRDANPFFHFMEALWMIGGRNDVAWPLLFNSNFGQFSDDEVIFNGAYGFRWRQWFGSDQLKSIIASLRENGECRRQVLGMWDPSRDLGSESKDIPCNLSMTAQIAPDGRLDIVVFNRSNDLIWGAYGANAVHFSMLQEYMAAALKVEVGTYTQVSSNTHIYKSHWEVMDALADLAPMPPAERECEYSRGHMETHPMVTINPIGRWERELDTFLKLNVRAEYRDPFFQHIAKPMFMAYVSFKEKANPSRFVNARRCCRDIIAYDWQRACIEWINRRESKWMKSQGA